MIDKTTEINSKFLYYYVGRIPKTATHDLYSCSLDDAPETIENDRK